MTHRLCIIGNSHVAAFATGWKGIAADWPGIAVTFFAARGAQLGSLKARNGALSSDNREITKSLEWISGGRASIVAADYDEFWLVGLRFGVETIMSVYEAFWSEGHSPDPSRMPISDPAFSRAAESLLRQSVASGVYRKLRSISNAPVSLFPQPNPSSAAIGADEARTEPFRLAARNHDEAVLWHQYRAAMVRVAGEMQVRLCEQPDHTREQEIFTAVQWGRGATRLKPGLEREHGSQDTIHMNEKYGALMLKCFLPQIAKPLIGTATKNERGEHEGFVVEDAGRT